MSTFNIIPITVRRAPCILESMLKFMIRESWVNPSCSLVNTLMLFWLLVIKYIGFD